MGTCSGFACGDLVARAIPGEDPPELALFDPRRWCRTRACNARARRDARRFVDADLLKPREAVEPVEAASAIARSWIARPVESKIVISSSSARPARVAREHRAELGHVAARDQTRLDRVLRARRRGSPAPSRRRRPGPRQLGGRDLGLARAVRAHEAHVLARPERPLGEQHLVPRRHRHDARRPRAPLRGDAATEQPSSSAAVRARSRVDVPERNVRAPREERPRRRAAVDPGADTAAVAASGRASVSAASTAAAPVRSAVTAPASSTASSSPVVRVREQHHARSPSASRAPGCPGTTSPTSAARDRRRAPASRGSRRPGSSSRRASAASTTRRARGRRTPRAPPRPRPGDTASSTCRGREDRDSRQRALTPATSFTTESLASPNSIAVFGSRKSGLSMPGEPGRHRPLHDDDLARLVDVQDRHPVDRAARFVARGRVDDVVRADHEHDVRLRELRVDLVHLLERRYGTFASASRTFMWPGIRPATGWIA